MAIQIERSTDETALVRFLLPESEQPESVSVVGTFNDWTPGAHTFNPDSDGHWSVTIEVPRGQEIVFRYLGDNGRWFDEPDAQVSDENGGRITADVPASDDRAAQDEPLGTADTVDRDGTMTDVDFDKVRADEEL